jgi:hypothetical protein
MLQLAQSFSSFSAQDGRQVHRHSWIWATSLCYILLNKFVTLVGSGRRTCHPSRDEKGLKDWAIVVIRYHKMLLIQAMKEHVITYIQVLN